MATGDKIRQILANLATPTQQDLTTLVLHVQEEVVPNAPHAILEPFSILMLKVSV